MHSVMLNSWGCQILPEDLTVVLSRLPSASRAPIGPVAWPLGWKDDNVHHYEAITAHLEPTQVASNGSFTIALFLRARPVSPDLFP